MNLGVSGSEALKTRWMLHTFLPTLILLNLDFCFVSVSLWTQNCLNMKIHDDLRSQWVWIHVQAVSRSELLDLFLSALILHLRLFAYYHEGDGVSLCLMKYKPVWPSCSSLPLLFSLLPSTPPSASPSPQFDPPRLNVWRTSAHLVHCLRLFLRPLNTRQQTAESPKSITAERLARSFAGKSSVDLEASAPPRESHNHLNKIKCE